MPKTTNLGSLLAQKAALDKQIADLQKAQRGEAIARVKALMAEYGLTPADLVGGKAAAPAPAPAADGAPAPRKRAKAAGITGRKVAPKYRDPATGNTWTGRGLKPRWLTAALAEGRTLADFTI